MRNGVRIFLIILGLIFPLIVSAQKATIGFSSETGKSLQIDPSELKHIMIKAIGHDNKEHVYSGVLLSDILTKAGIVPGEAGKNKTINSYLQVKAKDNYMVIYALAEIDPIFASNTIILADRQDGKVLEAEDGPFQIVVPGEKKHARWIRQVISMDLRSVK